MARRDGRNPDNSDGAWFIDTRCINCGASPHVGGDLIDEVRGRCVFVRQPENALEIERAWLAVDVCPTNSVGAPANLPRPRRTFPVPVIRGVFLCGFNSVRSFGAHSWLVLRPDGNLMIDSPSFNRRLVPWLDELGVVSTILLTHRDDVADAARWAEHFGSRVVIHSDDASAARFATDVVTGADAEVVADGVIAVPVPGHTRGSIAYVVDEQFAFTGDSLAWDPVADRLEAFEDACWYSWSVQRASLARLADYSFSTVLPGHGKWSPRLSPADMRVRLLDLVSRM